MSEQLPSGGIELSPGEIDALHVKWSSCWTPSEVAQQLAGIGTPWYVAAGWALDLFRGRQTRAHGDIEIAIPAARFPEVRYRFPGYVFDAVGSGRIWEDAIPEVLAPYIRLGSAIRPPATTCSTCSANRTTATPGSADEMRGSGFPTATSSTAPETASRIWRPNWSCCSRQSTPVAKINQTSTRPSHTCPRLSARPWPSYSTAYTRGTPGLRICSWLPEEASLRRSPRPGRRPARLLPPPQPGPENRQTLRPHARTPSPAHRPAYRPTLVDPYREHLRRRRAKDPAVPVTHLLEEIRELGYTGSANLLVRYVNQGRAEGDRPSPPHVTPAASCSPIPKTCARRKRPCWRRSLRPARR